MKRWRVGIVGLGAAARNIHLPALRKLGFVEIVGGFDPLASVDGIPSFLSIEALLAEKLDLVIIATPPAARIPVIQAAFAAGCHIFCEKPLANSLAEADEIIALANAAGRHLVLNSEFPFMPIHRAARKLIGAPQFGALRFLDVQQYFHVTDNTEAGWRGTDIQRTFKEFGTHVLDLCIDFFGQKPIGYDAVMPGIVSGTKPDYLNLVRLQFSGDRFAQITLDRFTKGRHRYLEMRLVGEHATIETSIGGRASLAVGVNPQGRKPFLDIDVAGGGIARLYTGERYRTIARSPLDLFADATARLLTAALEAIETGGTPPNNLADARATLAILYGCYDLARTHIGS